MEGKEHLLVILGAGSSHDLDPTVDADESVPLAKDLFDVRYGAHLGEFQAAQNVMRELRRRVDDEEPVEEILEDIESRAMAGYPVLHRALLGIKYYLADLVSSTSDHVWSKTNGVTNLGALVAGIDEWRHALDATVSYVTFNYDTVLERSCRSVMRVAGISDYIAGPHTRIYKVHGSVNWGRGLSLGDADGSAPIYRQDFLDHAEDYVPFAKGEFHFLENPISRISDGQPWLPVIAIPTITKSVYACPDAHRDHLYNGLTTVTRVLLIGWRAREDHFLKDLHQFLRKDVARLIVGNSEDGVNEVAHNLRKLNLLGMPQFNWGGFSGFMSRADLLSGFLGHPRPH